MGRLSSIFVTTSVLIGIMAVIIGMGFVPIPMKRCGTSVANAILSDNHCTSWGSIGNPGPKIHGYCKKSGNTCFRFMQPLWKVLFPPHVRARNIIICVALIITIIVIITILYHRKFYTTIDYHSSAPCDIAVNTVNKQLFPPGSVLQTRPMRRCEGVADKTACNGTYGCHWSSPECKPASCEYTVPSSTAPGQMLPDECASGSVAGSVCTLGPCNALKFCGNQTSNMEQDTAVYSTSDANMDIHTCMTLEDQEPCSHTTKDSTCLVYSTPCHQVSSSAVLTNSELAHSARTLA